MLRHFIKAATFAVFAILATAGSALAAEGIAEPWQMGFQPAASPVAERIHGLNHILLWLSVGITLLVLALMGYIIFRFNAKRNPTPSSRTHNTLLEVLWTAVPVLILMVVAVPSLKLLFFMDRTYSADMTLKVTGHQWYWSYEYPDNGEFAFDSFMVPDDELEEGQPRLLTVDNEVVLPVDTDVRILMTSSDVIHSWAIPAFGIKTDTVPGRTNEAWVRITREGTYHGQCSELCGVNHGFMPITVRAVSKPEFDKWAEDAQQEFASADGPARRVAQNAASSAAR
jgi:cytochrome c oxidase subunit 2